MRASCQSSPLWLVQIIASTANQEASHIRCGVRLKQEMILRDIQYITSMFSLQIANNYLKVTSNDDVCFKTVHVRKTEKILCYLFIFLSSLSYRMHSYVNITR